MSRSLVSVIVVIGLIGCDDLNKAPQRQAVSAPGGLAPVGDPSVQPGSATPVGAPPTTPVIGATPIPAAPPATPLTPQPVGTGSAVINQSTNQVVDAVVALQNPNIKVVENKITGSDPLSASMTAYVSVRSKASLLGMDATVRQFKVVEDRNPTYDEFMKMMRENRVEFTALYQGQMYGYDSQKGGILILEDSSKKAGGQN
ncbi:MAG: hypothetical protein HZA46_23975 [Planctomycetales bacterium]|nr:hypothetical protein [Planctomycetales bacterium]